MRVTTRTLAREFKAGRSMVGLARKYRLTRREVENRLRVYLTISNRAAGSGR